MRKKAGLGRNLNALLGGTEPRLLDDGEVELRVDKVLRLVSIEKLHPGAYQPRQSIDDSSLRELAQSISVHGIIQPIVVRPLSNKFEEYEIIAGERRWRAAKLAELTQVPVIIKDIPNQAALAIALIENIQRQELNPLEEAKAYKRLLDEFDLTHQQISDAVGKSRTTITNILRLMNLEEDVQKMLESGDIDFGHAKLLLSLHGQKQLEVAREIIKRNLTVRESELLVKKHAEDRPISKVVKPKVQDPNVQYYQERFQNRLGTNVSISKTSKGNGKITIEFSNMASLEELLNKFTT